MPAETPAGKHRLEVRRTGGSALSSDILIVETAPGLFAANADGKGAGAMGAVRVAEGGAQTVLEAVRYDDSEQRFVPAPISLGEETERVYLNLYGTGLRNVSALSKVSAKVNGVSVPVTYAGAQGQFVGLDQVNVGPLPRTLVGAGTVNVEVAVDGYPANVVTVSIE